MAHKSEDIVIDEKKLAKVLLPARWVAGAIAFLVTLLLGGASLIFFMGAWMSTKTNGDQLRDSRITAIESDRKEKLEKNDERWNTISSDVKTIKNDIEWIRNKK